MPDTNLIIAAVQSYVTTLNGAIRHHTANAGRCKAWSAAIVAGIMVFAMGRVQSAALPWAASVVVLLALADACQVVMARVFTDAYNRFMKKLPLNGGNAMKAEDSFVLPPPELGWRQAGQVLGALGSFSVWPFYGTLLALVVGFHMQASHSAAQPPQLGNAAPPAARVIPQSAAKPGQGSVQASLPMKVITPFPNASRVGPGNPPVNAAPQQPGLRTPAATPMRVPGAGDAQRSARPIGAGGGPGVQDAGGMPAKKPDGTPTLPR